MLSMKLCTRAVGLFEIFLAVGAFRLFCLAALNCKGIRVNTISNLKMPAYLTHDKALFIDDKFTDFLAST